MVPAEQDRSRKLPTDIGGGRRRTGRTPRGRKARKPRRWYERTSVTLCVAAALVFVGFGFIHVITGVESEYVLPLDVARKSAFGYRETFINAPAILALPYLVAKDRYPIGCRVLQDKGYMSSGRHFETRAVVTSWDNIRRWQEQFDRASGPPVPPWQERLRDWPESPQEDATEARSYNQHGIALAQTAQYAEAIAEFTRAIQKAPARTEPYHNRALVHIAIGNLGQAADDFGKIAEIEPGSLEGYLRRGRLHVATNQYDRAIADFTEVIEIDPRCSEAYFKRALAYYAKGQYDQAWTDLGQLPGLNASIPSEFLAALEDVSNR